jgi:hypothetical protein
MAIPMRKEYPRAIYHLSFPGLGGGVGILYLYFVTDFLNIFSRFAGYKGFGDNHGIQLSELAGIMGNMRLEKKTVKKGELRKKGRALCLK